MESPGQACRIIQKDIHSGKTDKASVQLVISGKYDYGPKANLYLDLLEAALQFRLNTRLREAEGGVYSAPGKFFGHLFQ